MNNIIFATLNFLFVVPALIVLLILTRNRVRDFVWNRFSDCIKRACPRS